MTVDSQTKSESDQAFDLPAHQGEHEEDHDTLWIGMVKHAGALMCPFKFNRKQGRPSYVDVFVPRRM